MENNNPEIDRDAPVVIPEPGQPTAQADAVEPHVEETPATDDSSSSTDTEESENGSSTEENLDELIANEKKRGVPDPEKARERFLKKQQEKSEPEEDIDDDDKPLTRREAEELIERGRQLAFNEASAERIDSISLSIAESPKEAELIKAIHSNRIFPEGMSLQEQLQEAKIIATHKRTAAKAAELARTVQSQETRARDTASTHRDAQANMEPKLAVDIKNSLKAAGYTYNGEAKRYEKKLPNGKKLVTVDGKKPYLV